MVFVNGKTGKRIPLEKVMSLVRVFINVHNENKHI